MAINDAKKNVLSHAREAAENDDTTSSSKKVAIIGAGFAGLTLANYLQSYHQCTILESKEEPISIVGTFRLPLHIADILEPIRQMRGIEFPSSMKLLDSSKWLVSRPQLLTWLREGGIPIHYSAAVQAVKRVSTVDKGYILTIRSSNGEVSEMGPFDIVVVATGFSLNKNDWVWDCTAMVGDARCSRHAWWDIFGLTRIQKGGAMAMMDAKELATRILQEQDLREYSPQWLQRQLRKQHQRKRIMQFLFITLLVVHIFRATQKLPVDDFEF